jgi:type VI secretion system protein ImpJ
MLLSPQHLQALDRYHEALLAARLGALAPLDHGILACEFDQAALATGQLRMVRFAGVLPDGLPVAFDDPEGGPPARDAMERFPAAARALEVHLAVPREREGVPSYGDEGAPSPSRFLAASRPLQDATAPGATVPVRLARPNALLLLGDEAREDHESLQVAELVRGPSGQLQLSESWLPPCLRLSAAPRLLAALRELSARAIAKQRDLSAARRGREGSSELTGPDTVRLLQLLVLAGAVPALAHLAESGDATPREAYLALAGLAGQLCVFRGDDPATLPKLLPGDLRATFDPLLARLSELLNLLAVQQYLSIPLEQRAGGLYLARLAEERLLKGQLFLAVKSDHPEAMVAEQLPRLCKIASAAEIQGLVQAAAPGLPLQVAHRPPPQLPVHPGTIYFALQTGDRYWQGIVAARNAAIYLPPPFDPARTKLELLVVLAEPAAAAPRPPARP